MENSKLQCCQDLKRPFWCGISLLFFAGLSQAVFQEPGDQGKATTLVVDEESPLIVNMEVIEDGLRALRADLSDATKLTARLGLVLEMQNAAKAAKVLLPPIAEQQPESERAAFAVAYRKEMIAVEEELLRLERAILDSNLEAAKASYKALKQMEEDGHARFTEDG